MLRGGRAGRYELFARYEAAGIEMCNTTAGYICAELLGCR
ncbi:hypothetical protein SPHINGOT1_510020 [Sphingomonas sp. T1]|nr:hypothetical protein SPHINGOT1_510020 [Sphingomonas sp. T1]